MDDLVNFGKSLSDSNINVTAQELKTCEQVIEAESIEEEVESGDSPSQMKIIKDFIKYDKFSENFHTASEIQTVLKQRGHNFTVTRVSTYYGRIYKKDANLLDRKRRDGKSMYRRHKIIEQSKVEPYLSHSQLQGTSNTSTNIQRPNVL